MKRKEKSAAEEKPVRRNKKRSAEVPTDAATGEIRFSREEERRKKRRRIKIRRFLTLLIVAALIVLIALNWDWLSPAAIVRRLRISQENRGTGISYPLDVTQENVLALCGLEKGGLLLTNTGYYALSGSGAARYPHSFSDPTVNAFDACAVLFSKGGSRYIIQSQSGKMYEGEADAPLISASCASNGACALLTKASVSTTRLTVLSSSRKELFAQSFFDNTACMTALSRNAHRIAVASVNTVNRQLSAAVDVFDISRDEAVAHFELGDEMVLGMSFSKNGGLSVLCDRAAFFFSADCELMDTLEYGGELCGSWYSADGCLAVLTDNGSLEAGKQLTVYRMGTRVCSVAVPAEVSAVSLYGGKIACLSNDRVLLLNASGESLGGLEAAAADRVCVISDGVLIMTEGEMKLHPFSDFA